MSVSNVKEQPSPTGYAVGRLLSRFAPFVRGYWAAVAALVAFVAMAPAMSSAIIWMQKLLVDDVLAPGRLDLLTPYCAVYLGLAVSKMGFDVGYEYLSTWVGERFTQDVRIAAYDHLLAVSPDVLGGRRLGDVLSRLGGDTDAIEDMVVGTLISALRSCFSLAYYAGALALLNGRLAVLLLVTVPPLYLIAARCRSAIRSSGRDVRQHVGSTTALAEETLSRLLLVQAYGREPFERSRFADQSAKLVRAWLQSSRLRIGTDSVVALVGTAGGLLVIWVGAQEVGAGRLTLGALVATLSYVQSLYRPLASLASLVGRFQLAAASAERVAEILDMPVASRATLDATGQTPDAASALELRNVWFGYMPGQPVLRGVSFRVQPGEVVALVGATGAGKSTITKLILRLHDPQAGVVLVGGRDARAVPLTWLREQIAFVPQAAAVLDGTIEHNILYGRLDASAAEVEHAAQLAHAAEFIRRLPDGYQTQVGQKGTRLSGGERQRLAIARALVRNSPIMILDEGTAAVDAESERLIQRALRSPSGSRCAVVIAHRLSTVLQADRIVVLDNGRVVEQGTHSELVARGGVYLNLFRDQITAGHGRSSELVSA